MHMRIVVLALLCCGWAFPEEPVRMPQQWSVLEDFARITYYGPRYIPGAVTASGELYYHGAMCALGPALLYRARALSGLVWGMRVRITDPATGRQGVYRVMDTGLPKLGLDLPDPQWLEFGYPAERGVFMARIEVLHGLARVLD